MKKLKIIYLAVLAAFVLSASIIFNGCQKQQNDLSEDQMQIDDAFMEKSLKFYEKVTSFKDRMELYRDHPQLKTEIKYAPEEAVQNLEQTLNFTYGYGVSDVLKRERVSTDLIMPLDVLIEIGDGDLSDFYFEDLIIEIRNNILDLNLNDPKLLYVDLDYMGLTENHQAEINIDIIVGEVGNPPIVSTEVGWFYGEEGGDCNNLNPTTDASILLENDLNLTEFPWPGAAGYQWEYEIINESEELNPVSGGFDNLEDDIPDDNYQDKLIFFAREDFSYPTDQITDDDKCVSTDAEQGWNLEMEFYRNSYEEIGNGYLIDNEFTFLTYEIMDDQGDMPTSDGSVDYVCHILNIKCKRGYLVPVFAKANILD